MKVVQGILTLSDRKLAKLALLLVILLALLGPGAIVLLFVGLPQWSTIGLWHLLGLCAAISVPFSILGILTFVHPFQTLVDLSKSEPRHAMITVIVSSSVWAVLNALIISVVVLASKKALSEVVGDDIRVLYGAVFLLVSSVFGILTYVNAGRFLRLYAPKKG